MKLASTLFCIFLSVQVSVGQVIDPSFGDGEWALVQALNPDEFMSPVAIASTSENELFVAGNLGIQGEEFEPFLLKLIEDGSPDESFGNSGFVNPVTANGLITYHNMILTVDESILCLGTLCLADDIPNKNIIVDKFNPDGSPDEEFGMNGRAIIELSHYQVPYNLEIDSSGKIYISVRSQMIPFNPDFYTCHAFPSADQSMVVRLNLNGSLDAGFGQEGALMLPDNLWYTINGIKIIDDGILAFGQNAIGPVCSKYDFNGNLDLEFGDAGHFNSSELSCDQIQQVKELPNGNIIFFGRRYINTNWGYGNSFSQYQLDSEGVLLPEYSLAAFDTLTEWEFPVDILSLSGGDLIVHTGPHGVIGLGSSIDYRINPDLGLVSSFGNEGLFGVSSFSDGEITTIIGNGSRATLDNEERVIVVCSSSEDESPVLRLFRYNPNLSLSTIAFESRIQIKAYPNPTLNSWQIRSEEQIQSIEIINALGSGVWTKEPNASFTEIDAFGFESGIYFARFKTAKGISVMKLVKK